VDAPQTEKELERLRRSVHRGRPFGDDSWVEKVAAKLGLEFTLHAVGQPRKGTKK